ncbi:MAG: Imm8 family immunity protein [Verrucomicrobiota bacterium]
MDIDLSKSIEELEGDDWGPPDFDSHVVSTCHELRKKPIKDFEIEELRFMILQNVGSEYLAPLACVDHDPIDQWAPVHDYLVYYSLCLHIGPENEEGADLFYVDIATPQAIKHFQLGKTVSDKSIILNPYSWPEVLTRVKRMINHVSGVSWQQVAEELDKSFSWEFSGYPS